MGGNMKIIRIDEFGEFRRNKIEDQIKQMFEIIEVGNLGLVIEILNSIVKETKNDRQSLNGIKNYETLLNIAVKVFDERKDND